ncbi:MAG TPA: UDP-N-acetylmuramoyl-L-alanyl-D-glutamate--2,6-diaminopimelate ligase [Armatimonadota bacterium]|jgi:UDP-N-acetylmuramoyl-L-alanyl-D-glutamate--2,6-diaminopimelate ligase
MPTLASLTATLSVTLLGNPDTEVRGIQYDSRQVQPGDLFACVPGTKTHGHHFIPQVLQAGAAALLVEDAAVVPAGVAAIVVPDSRRALAEIAAAFYHHPCERLTVIGVTGTNGKTTTTTLLWQMLRAAGHPTGLIGTMAYHIGDEVLAAPHTTPQAPDLQALLARMCDAGLTHVVMEVSSHALCLHRVTGCRFHLAAFTNLTQDHLDFHGTMEAYRAAKIDLFASPQYQPTSGAMTSLLNRDDPSAELFAAQARGPVRRFGLTGGDYQACDVVLRAAGSRFTLRYPGGVVPVTIQLVGSFNVSNALAALALALELGVDPLVAAQALAEIPPVDGRFQRVPSRAGQPSVVVDYAHTPDGLDNVLRTAHEIAPGRVVAVFGCGGDRDRTKRPQMAAIAARWARTIFVTSDNPRSEPPERIIEEILAGFTAEQRARVTVEADRAAAIRRAIISSTPEDLVVLAGKGHETYQILADRTVHFDDREEAVRALAAWSTG